MAFLAARRTLVQHLFLAVLRLQNGLRRKIDRYDQSLIRFGLDEAQRKFSKGDLERASEKVIDGGVGDFGG